MDPLTALGLAASVVQFVSFASKIIATVASSDASGAPAELVSLDDVYTRLCALSHKLAGAGRASTRALGDESDRTYLAQPQSNHGLSFEQLPGREGSDDVLNERAHFPTLRDSYRSLSELSALCEKECAKIMTIVEKLKASHNPSSRWSTLSTAVKLQWKKNEIERLEGRLGKFQRIVLTEMCNLSTIYHDMHSKDLASFRQESQKLGVQHTAQLKAIDSALRKLADRRDGLDGAPAVSSPATELSALQQMMSHVRLSERDITRELAIVSSLGFPSRTVRHEAIASAHKETFEWVFRTKTEPEPCQEAAMSNTASREDKPNLLEWLKHGAGTFWVSGKPGSGKSTFMKFITDHPATRSALSRWAHPLPVVVASHYFWSSGTEMQRSLQGLLQTLLYDIFRHCPDLIRVACPSRWEAEQQENQPPWTLPQLRTALAALSAQSKIACKFCFFVDGLDEFDGEHIDFCETLTAMTDSPNIKLCVSSRPWNVFEDGFGRDMERKLYIHELTRTDILRYARDRLHQHPRWHILGLQTARANLLIESIADKAQGVFLWVTIVTRLLREGLTNDDTPADLRRRLESFPSDLEPFFKQIVESVPEFYRSKMAETLWMAMSAHEPLDAMIYSFHDDEGYDYGAVDDEFALQPLGWECSAEEIQNRREQVARRLNGRCRGLLEPNLTGQIDFLHRTVADFLRTWEMSSFLAANTAPDFSPNLAILRAYTAWVRTAGLEDPHFSLEHVSGGTSESNLDTQLGYNVKKALEYAHKAEFEGVVPESSLDTAIDEMDHNVSALISNLPLTSRKQLLWPDVMHLFRELVLEVPLLGYLSRKLPQDPTYFFGFDGTALSVVLHRPDPPPTRWPVLATEKLRCLLQYAHDPNQQLPGTGLTIWTDFLSETMLESDNLGDLNSISMGPRFLAALKTGLFLVFLEHGANPNAGLPPLSSPFDRLAVLGFDIPVDKLYQDDYLRVLDGFISRGAKLSGYYEYMQPVGPTGIPRKHPCAHFFDRLCGTMNDIRPQFRVDVLRRVLPLAQEAQWPLDQHHDLIDKVLPSFYSRKTERSSAASAEEEAPRGKAETTQAGKRRLADARQEKRRKLRRLTFTGKRRTRQGQSYD